MSVGTDFPDWSPHVAQAQQIAATGVPLLSAKNLLGSATTNVAANTLVSVGPFAISQPSYELQITAYQNGAGSASPLQMLVNWNDSTTSATTAQELWYIWPGVAISDHIIYGKGPTKADQLVIQFNNLSSAMPYSVFWRAFQSSRLFTRDDLRSIQYLTTASGGALPTQDVRATLLGFQSVSVNAGASVATELPLYAGPAQLYADTGSGTTDFNLKIQDSAQPNAEGTGTRLLQFQSDSHGLILAQIALPRYQCRVSMLNSNAAAKFLTYSLHSID